jgi:hypothetical protein
MNSENAYEETLEENVASTQERHGRSLTLQDFHQIGPRRRHLRPQELRLRQGPPHARQDCHRCLNKALEGMKGEGRRSRLLRAQRRLEQVVETSPRSVKQIDDVS